MQQVPGVQDGQSGEARFGGGPSGIASGKIALALLWKLGFMDVEKE